MTLNWEVELDNADKVFSIDNDFFLIDNPVIASAGYPFKVDINVVLVCTSGYAKGSINLKSYVAQAPSVTIVMAGQISQYEHVSEDFSGFLLVMSRRFADDLLSNMQERLFLRDNPCFPLNGTELDLTLDYYNLLKKTQRIEDLSIRREMVKHLSLAFHYALTYFQSHILRSDTPQSRQSVLFDRFIKLVEENFHEQCDVGFYADRLCLTPKYLSKVIRDSSGASAGEWIDNYVTLEAKALLKSTGMTVQQISDELNFPSQSFFGKFFKRVVGVSPKEYKRS